MPALAKTLASDSSRLFPLQLDRVWIKVWVGPSPADEGDDPQEEPLGHKVDGQAATLEEDGIFGGQGRVVSGTRIVF